MFYQSASQQETDGILKLGQFEEILIKGLFTKAWAGEPQGWKVGADTRSPSKRRLGGEGLLEESGFHWRESQPVTPAGTTPGTGKARSHLLPSPAPYQQSSLAEPRRQRTRASVCATHTGQHPGQRAGRAHGEWIGGAK